MQRRDFIKKATTTTAGAILPFTIWTRNHFRGAEGLIVGQGDFRYRVDRNWARTQWAGLPLLNCHEMVEDRQGRLIMVGDHTANNVIIFDRSGEVLDYWGTRFPCGHGLTLSAEGDEDFLLISDCGSHVDRKGRWRPQSGGVYKTRINGDVLFQLGHPQTIGVYEPGQAYHPTETAVAPNGDIYVADGYGSNYVIRYDRHGRYIQHFGGKDNEDPNYNLDQAHGVAVDLRNPDQPRLAVTSRNEQSFKFFTLDGRYLETVTLPGAYVCRPVLHGDHLFAGVCFADTRDGKKKAQNHGYITILDREGKVVSNPGGAAPNYENGSLQTMFQDPAVAGIFAHGHDVCVDEDENLYMCQWNASRTPPIRLERVV